MSDSRIKVLFIAGMTRSGSTVLADLLGQVEHFVSIGELSAVWNRGFQENQFCSCWSTFRECSFWQRAVGPYLDAPKEEIDRILRLRNALHSMKVLRRLALGGHQSFRREAEEYARLLGPIYKNIQETTECAVIVDSSKFPFHGYGISLIPYIDLHVLHLVRDPRAVVFSWQRRKAQTPPVGEQKYMPRFSTRRAAFNWVVYNAMCELLWRRRSGNGRYLRVRYEDFARHPKDTLLRIINSTGSNPPMDFFVDDVTARRDQETHQVSGNPVRYESGMITIALDREWSSQMPRKHRLLTTSLTFPLLSHYGYRIRGDAS